MAMADMGDKKIWYELDAEASDVVVLAAGSGMPPGVWDLCGVPDALRAAGYSVLTYAASGVKPTEGPPPESVGDLTAELTALLQHLGIQRCRVVGYSLGGFVAEDLSHTEPSLVQSAVLIASAGPTSPVLRSLMDAAAAFIAADGRLPEAFCRWEELLTSLPPSILQDDAAQVAEWWELSAAHEQVWASEAAKVGQWNAAAGWAADDARVERLADIALPVLVVAYEHDLLFPPALARTAADELRRGAFIQIEGAAHGGLVTHQEKTATAIVDFLRSA